MKEELEKEDVKVSDTAIATTSRETAMSTAGGLAPELTGDFGVDDFRIPTLNIVQAVGPLSDKFPNQAGAICFNKEVLLSPPPAAGQSGDIISLTVVGGEKRFVENLPYGSDQMPQTVDTVEQVRELGGTLQWVGDERPTWAPVFNAYVLIEGDPEIPGFMLEHDGRWFAPAVWSMRSTAYKRAATLIISAARLSLRDGLANGKWSLSAKREKIGQNFVFVPILKQAGRNSKEFVDFIKNNPITI